MSKEEKKEDNLEKLVRERLELQRNVEKAKEEFRRLEKVREEIVKRIEENKRERD